MVASNDIFDGCQEHFVTSILAVLRWVGDGIEASSANCRRVAKARVLSPYPHHRPKILIPGVTIYNRDDMTREVLFLEEGELEVSNAWPMGTMNAQNAMHTYTHICGLVSCLGL